MRGDVVKLSETRWRYATARRVYYVRQVKAPNEDRAEPGRYWVDAGADGDAVVTADSVDNVFLSLDAGALPPRRAGGAR
jgi:hypothetical protein